MKVLILKNSETAEVNDSYGARLIEQGKAVAIPAGAEGKPEPAAKAEPKAETVETAPTRTTGKSGKRARGEAK